MSHFLISGLLVLAVLVTTTAGDDSPPFKINTKRDNDKVEVKVEQDKAVFSVQSPVGISQAIIQRTNDKWPDAMVFRLHLKGLEKLRVTNDMQQLEASVSSSSGKVRLWKDGKENSPLDAKSPYWMKLRMVGRDGKRAQSIPLKNGYFEMQLPKAFFEGNPKSITVNWIDFYRN